jgi:hypothetical protein
MYALKDSILNYIILINETLFLLIMRIFQLIKLLNEIVSQTKFVRNIKIKLIFP